MKKWVSVIITSISLFSLSLVGVTANKTETINDLLYIYRSDELTEKLEMYDEYVVLKNKYTSLLSNSYEVELFNRVYKDGVKLQKEKQKQILSELKEKQLFQNELKDELNTCIHGSVDTLLSIYNQYDVNNKDIQLTVNKLNSFTMLEEKVFNEEEFYKLQEEILNLEIAYSELGDGSFIGEISTLKSPVDNISIEKPFGQYYDLKSNSLRYSNIVTCSSNNASVKALFNGRVVYVGESIIDGKYVVIDHGCEVSTYYCNMETINVNIGDTITQYDTIGTCVQDSIKNLYHLGLGIYIEGVPKNPLLILRR